MDCHPSLPVQISNKPAYKSNVSFFVRFCSFYSELKEHRFVLHYRPSLPVQISRKPAQYKSSVSHFLWFCYSKVQPLSNSLVFHQGLHVYCFESFVLSDLSFLNVGFWRRDFTVLLFTRSIISILSQLSKCLKFMTFQEGCFVVRNWMQVLKWSSWGFLSPLSTIVLVYKFRYLGSQHTRAVSALSVSVTFIHKEHRFYSAVALLYQFRYVKSWNSWAGLAFWSVSHTFIHNKQNVYSQ